MDIEADERLTDGNMIFGLLLTLGVLVVVFAALMLDFLLDGLVIGAALCPPDDGD